jgi:hypothetical protein
MRAKSLQSGIENVRELATKYDKQQLARMAQMGLVGPEDAVMAGLMIDRIAQAAMRPPTTTVAQDVLGQRPQIQQVPQGVAGLQQSPGAPQGPEAAPQGVAGLPSNLPRMAHGGMVAFAGDEGSLVGDPYGNEMNRQAPALPMRGPTPFGPRGSVPVQEFAPPSEVTLQGAMKQQDESQKLAGFDPEFYTKTREEELAKKKESPARKNQAIGDALMMWGAGMLGARQGQEWATASESAKQSLLMYQGAMKEIRDSEKEIDKTARELHVAQNQFLHNKSEKASAKVDAYTAKLAEVKDKNVEAQNTRYLEEAKLDAKFYEVNKDSWTKIETARMAQAGLKSPTEAQWYVKTTEGLLNKIQAAPNQQAKDAAIKELAQFKQSFEEANKAKGKDIDYGLLKELAASPANIQNLTTPEGQQLIGSQYQGVDRAARGLPSAPTGSGIVSFDSLK